MVLWSSWLNLAVLCWLGRVLPEVVCRSLDQVGCSRPVRKASPFQVSFFCPHFASADHRSLDVSWRPCVGQLEHSIIRFAQGVPESFARVQRWRSALPALRAEGSAVVSSFPGLDRGHP